MRVLLLLCIVLLPFNVLNAQQVQSDKTTSKLARSYYNSGEYEKASVLYQQLYNKTSISSHFDSFINCLINLQQYKQAAKEVQGMVRKKPHALKYRVTLGFIYETQGLQEKGRKEFQKAIDRLSGKKNQAHDLFNAFVRLRKYEWAEQALDRTTTLDPSLPFHHEKVRLYRMQRNYRQMTLEMLKWVVAEPKKRNTIQSYLSSSLSQDDDERVAQQILTPIEEAVKKEGLLYHQQLLAWCYFRTRQYARAFGLYTIINKLTRQEERMIFDIAREAASNDNPEVANRAFSYLIALGTESSHFMPAIIEQAQLHHREITDTSTPSAEKVKEVMALLQQSIEKLQGKRDNYKLFIMAAQLEAFYLHQPQKAIERLEQAMKIPRLNAPPKSEIKLQMADICVLMNDPWQATLFYSQVIENMKENPLADRAKWSKAQLAFYMGDFTWAKAQLDAMKGSTSKLTANDAIDLSLLIGNNINLDTTHVALKKFSRAQYLLFLKKEVQALATLDSLLNEYPQSPICDEALFQKAAIYTIQHNYQAAASLYSTIAENYASEYLADNALFKLAQLYAQQLNNPDKARETYRQLILRYPASPFSSDARKRFQQTDPSKTPLP